MRIPWVLVDQCFHCGIFGILKDTDVDPVLALLSIAPATEAGRDARLDLDLFPYTFDEEMVFVLSTSVSLRQASVFSERTEEGGMPVRRL